MNNKIDLTNFDFGQFRAEAIEQLKSGQSLTGKDGILTPLIKEILVVVGNSKHQRSIFAQKKQATNGR